MKRKSYITIVLVAIIVVLYSLPQISFDKDANEARKVVEEYFRYMNNGNKEAALNLQSEISRNPEIVEWYIRDYIKLIWIKEGSKLLRASYMTHGLGKIENPYDVRVFHIVYYEHYKKGSASPESNGIKFKDITITKKSKDSPWRISAIGEG